MASQLDPLTLGLVLAGLGMGGTLLTLFVLSLIVDLLKRLFPAEGSGVGGQGPAQGPGVGGQGSGQIAEAGSRPAASSARTGLQPPLAPPTDPRPPTPDPQVGRP